MSVLEIEQELEKMTNAERRIVIEIAAKLIRKDSAEKRWTPLEEKRAKLRKSAEIMLPEYTHDKNLTALTSLDAEDFADA